MKEMRRILALIMCVVMLVGYMPVSAHATEDTGVAAETPVVASDVPSEEPSSEASGETTEPETVAVTGITLNPTELVVPVGEPNMALTVTVLPENATDKTVTWSSSDSEVVSVDEYGTMSFHKVGEAVITAAIGDFSATCNVTVGEAEPAAYVQSRANSADCLDAAIFCSDVHGSTSDLTSVLGGVKTSGVDYSSIGFVGDTCLTVDNTTSIVQSALSDTDISVMFSYASSHDTEDGADIDENWDYSGEVENISKYYLVYTIRETDMQNDTSAEDDFTTWYSGLTAAEKKLPIFIMSHRPLHHRRKDNANATDWYNAISAAAKTSDITFFWAHNHTSESSVDTDAYYVAKNGSESITLGTTSNSGGDTVTPNFTYMNAGYINANNQNPARIGVATTVLITADSLVFQDYTTTGEYSGTYAHNVEVAREFATEAVTLESIAISGDTEYFVGDELNLTVTATYSDTTTADVTADATLSGYDMSTAGTQTVTATYGDLEATIDITVTPIQIKSIAVTTQPTKVSYLTGEELDTTGMVVTATYNNGTTAEVTGWYTSSVDMTTAGQKEVTVNYVVDGITYKTTFTITVEQGVAEDVTLESIAITKDLTKKEYLISEELSLDGLEVTATFSDGSTQVLAYKPFSTSTIYGGYELHNFSMYVEKAHELTVVYTFGDVTCYDTTTINVWNEDFTDETTGVKVSVAEGDYGVTAVSVAESTNENVSAAIAEVISGTNYKAWDITLTLDADVDENGEAVYGLTNSVKTVTLPIPSGVNNPVVYYVSDDGTKVDNMNAVKDGNGNVTFETTHFSTYVVGESTMIGTDTDVTVPGSQVTTTTEKEVWVKVDAPVDGGEYLIVSTGTAGTSGYVMGNSTAVTPVSGTLTVGGTEGTYTYIETTGTVWTASGSGTSFSFQNAAGTYLGYTQTDEGGDYSQYFGGEYSYTLNTADSARTWTVSNNQVKINLQSSYAGRYGGEDAWSDYYLTGSSSWSMSTSSANVYFYQEQTATESVTTGTQEATYGMYITYPDADGNYVDTQQAITANNIIPGETLQLGAGFTSTVDGQTPPSGGTWTITSSNPNVATVDNTGLVTFTGTAGETLIQATYSWEQDGVTYSVSNYVAITAVPATDDVYTITMHKQTTDADGNPTAGDEITAPITIKNIQDGMQDSVWAVVKADGTDLGALGDKLTWTLSGDPIGTIDPVTGVVTFNGTEGTGTVTAYYTCPGGRVIQASVTYSVTVGSYTVPEDGTDDFPEYPDPGAIRFDKHATAVGNFSETGIAQVELSMTGVPYGTDQAIDVVVMLDMTGSMSSNGMAAAVAAAKAFVEKIVVDGTDADGNKIYNKNRVAAYQFNSSGIGTYFDLQMISSDAELETALGKIVASQSSGGTPFDEAASHCQTVLTNAKTDLPTGETTYNRKQFCVFMSDGGPTTYEGSDGYTYYGGNETSGDRKLTDYIGGYTSSTASNWTYNLPTEYYTDAMKADGVTVYTVGLLLQTAPSNPSPWSKMTDSTYDSTTDSLTTIGSHYYFTSTILKNMASDSNKYIDIFNVDNASKATAAFENIAESIKDAATDVRVEDKIASDYTMVFDAPNATVGAALPTGQEMYIEVKDYVLNPVYGTDGTTIVDYTRGTAASLMKLYLGKSGTTYYAASDANGTAYATPTFNQTAIGTMYYWTTTATSSGVSVTVDNTTYYFDEVGISSEDENFDSTKWFNMASGAYASGNITTTTIVDETTGATTTNELCNDLIIATPYFVYNAKTKILTWTAAKLSTSELALSYFVYLDESGGYSGAENETPAGTYETNEYAHLHYTNFQGTDCQQTFPVPQMTWNGAQVSYVFYLVNEAGQPVNRAGRVVPFSEAVYVTDVFTHSIVWNDLEQVASLEAAYLASELVPSVYSLYDAGASYDIHVFEDEAGQNLNNHFIIGSSSSTYTTYVFNTKADATKYKNPATYAATSSYKCKEYVEGGAYTDEKGAYNIVIKTGATVVETGFDFSNTTVAFAVTWTPGLAPDTVVVDYGLDVVIDVIKNDNMAAGVVGVRTTAPSGVTTEGTYDRVEADTLTSVDLYIDANNDETTLKELKIGTASVENLSSVRFSLDKTNGMQFTDPVEFYYEADVNYYVNSELKTTSMYSKVTVIPATTVYYEDEYVTLKTFTKGTNGDYTENSGWDTSSVKANATQAVDRPGVSKISEAYDADNVYGYDGAYSSMSTYSMGEAAMTNVTTGKYATAEFDFYGTGFDVIGVTSSLTGTMTIKVTGATSKNLIVDTYYGYTQDADGKWVVSENDPNALYQVPVMKVEDLPYGKYHVVITATYNTYFDNTDAGNYDLYLDAIRIYDPTGVISGEVENTTVENAYVADNEGWPIYEELRNNIITAQSYDAATETGEDLEGAIFIDCTDDNYSIADYVSYGPNNELYLDEGQAIAFNVDLSAYDYINEDGEEDTYVADVQLGMKLGNGESVSYKIYDAQSTSASDAKTVELKSATDMYYSIMDYADGTVTIVNTSGEILSLTNIKVTFKQNPAGIVSAASFMMINEETAGYALMSLRAPVVEEETEETEPETTVPEETEPEETVPETTVPEETEPEETVPETTVPKETEPADPMEQIKETVQNIVNQIVNALSNLFSKWFR